MNLSTTTRPPSNAAMLPSKHSGVSQYLSGRSSTAETTIQYLHHTPSQASLDPLAHKGELTGYYSTSTAPSHAVISFQVKISSNSQYAYQTVLLDAKCLFFSLSLWSEPHGYQAELTKLGRTGLRLTAAQGLSWICCPRRRHVPVNLGRWERPDEGNFGECFHHHPQPLIRNERTSRLVRVDDSIARSLFHFFLFFFLFACVQRNAIAKH